MTVNVDDFRAATRAFIFEHAPPLRQEGVHINHKRLRRLYMPRSGSSSDIRERAYKRMPLDGLVAPEVAAYIDRYNLYRGTMPQRRTKLCLASPRPARATSA